MYAWDESLETLYAHICWLVSAIYKFPLLYLFTFLQETRVINTSDWLITQELHVIRAHHLHYSALLEDFRKSVMFILNTPNPAMDSLPHEEREWSRDLLKKECDNLLSEISRLEKGRIMQDRRLKNVMNLVCVVLRVPPSVAYFPLCGILTCTNRFSPASILGIVNACRD
jgi:hypothetical protein